MAMVTNHPLLDREQELVLARHWKEHGDRTAGDLLVGAHQRLVVAVARKYRRYGIELAELIAEGNVGLVYALTKFEPERGNRLATYASHWIRAFVLDRVLRSWSLVGGGTGALSTKVFFKLRRERARMTSLVGEGEQADRLLAQRLDMDPERLRELLDRLENRDLRLDAPANRESGIRWIDLLPSPERNQEELVVGEETARNERNAVESALAALDRRERFVIERHVMADSDDELSLAEIGRSLGVSRERVRQLEERAKRKLRARIERSAA